MLTVNLLAPAAADTVGAAVHPGGHFALPREFLAAIARRQIREPTAEARDRVDAKRVIERAMEIDIEQPGSPLTEGQWDFGLDMLARADQPPPGSGLAVRQTRIVAVLSRAIAELSAEAKATAS
jgi:hypothetical protein